MNTKLLELRPDRALLDSDFNGYKLSLDKIPIYRKALKIAVDRVLPRKDQFSHLLINLLGLHNHLIGESINDQHFVYFIDKDWCIKNASENPFAPDKIKITEVFKIPTHGKHNDKKYNCSLKFTSEALAVASDGAGSLFVLKTGMPRVDSHWTCLFTFEPLGPQKCFVIQDVIYKEAGDNKHELHCLVRSIAAKNISLLHWVTLSNVDASWSLTSSRELKAKGFIDYAYFESSCDAIYVVSDYGIKFTVGSQNSGENGTSVVKTYKWSQSKDDVILEFCLPIDFISSEICINTEPGRISVKYSVDDLLAGKLAHKIDQELTTWAVNDNVLQVILIKSETGLKWNDIVEGDQAGVYLSERSLDQEGLDLHRTGEVSPQQCATGPTFNTEQLEECDVKDESTGIFERLCCSSHEVTHKACIGTRQVVLTCRLTENLPPALGIRYDVDTCLWQPQISGEDWDLKHEATLLAFSYIEASKQRRKFCTCAPDLGYALVCDDSHHLFIYRQNKCVTSGQLRHRTSGRRVPTFAQQQVVSLPDGEILGIYATNTVLFLLTANSIMMLRI